jgi:2-hydroxychromene-2-carboxylate isomerase
MSDKTKIDFYFCLNSPWVYLSQKRLESIASAAAAEIRYFPVDLREMMLRLIGHDDPPERSELHRTYGKLEMRRWAERYDLPLSEKPAFYPVSQKRAACLIVAADRLGADPGPLVYALPRACWMEDRDINDWKTLSAIAEECGMPGDVLTSAAQDQAVLEEFEDNTNRALDRGVFGIPSYVIDGEVFWGQDRLEFLEHRLKKLG